MKKFSPDFTTGRICKNIHGEWTLGWYEDARPVAQVRYKQLKGESLDALKTSAVQVGLKKVFVGTGNDSIIEL